MRIRDVLKRLEAEKAGAGAEPVDAPPSAANDEAKHAWRTPNAMDAPVKRPQLPAQRAAADQPVQKRKVLFVCIGNACRSQMAEAFATRYGADILEVSSAGLAPANALPELTKAVMKDKGITLDTQFCKGFEVFPPKVQWDVVVNMSGRSLPFSTQAERVIDWKVDDPMGQRQIVHERVRDEIENLVMRLILELRVQSRKG